jgi:predicted TIM-barrel fold metal-dependent hydrolase
VVATRRRSAGSFRQRLLDEMEALPTVDCHSHTVLRREYEVAPPRSLFTIGAYFDRDTIGLAGKRASALYADAPDDAERWRRLKGLLARGRNVSTWRHAIATFQGLFGLADDDLTDDNWAAVNARIKEYTARPGWYDYVTRERCNFVTQVRNVPWFEDWEPEYFTCVLRMEPALRLHQAAERGQLAAHLGRELGDLAALRRGLADFLDSYVRRGAIGIKLAQAYWRSLKHERVSEQTAAAIYARAVRGEELSPADVTAFEDHIVWYLAGLAADHGLVFQIHTGIQGNWCHVPDSDPLLLLELIRAHRTVRFDLFHAGYPYAREIGMAGKLYPNVWLNACVAYVYTMAGSRQALSEWIDLVPMERLLGFGSDVVWPEFMYGHLVMARACLADVLAEKVERDFLSKTVALDVARAVLHDSPAKLYGLQSAAESGPPAPAVPEPALAGH